MKNVPVTKLVLALVLTSASISAVAAPSLGAEVGCFATNKNCQLYLSEGVAHASAWHTLVPALQPVWDAGKRERIGMDKLDQMVATQCQRTHKS
jgi:hypothetical protein